MRFGWVLVHFGMILAVQAPASADSHLTSSTKSFAQSAMAGTNSSGGGQGVVLKNGAVRLLDLVSESDLRSDLMDSREIQNRFFESRRYVKRMAQKMPDFFECAVSGLKEREQDAPAFQRLISYLPSVGVLGVEFRISAPASPSAAQAIQEPLAVYNKGHIWVSSRLSSAMSAEDFCALSVHEALRHLNFGSITDEELSTPEIEAATRWVMGRSKNSDSLEAVIGKLNRLRLTAEDYRKLSEQKRKESEELSKKLYAEWGNLTLEQRRELDDKAWSLLTEAMSANTNAVGAALDDPTLRTVVEDELGIAGRAFLNITLTEELGWFKYFDVVALNIVHRLSH